MNQQLLAMLSESEQALLRETEADRLVKLDEDELLELHGRIRRARTKYTKLYRRRAAERVEQDSTRARASAVHQRTRVKAEVFEDVLATVSRRLAQVARANAAALRAERLGAARGEATATRPSARKSAPPASTARPARPTRPRRKTPISTKSVAATRAAGARRQATLDAE